MDLTGGTPFWPLRDGLISVYPAADRDETCDVVVVGGGITGALMALALTQAGRSVVVLERREVGWGSTSASTAMLQYEIDTTLLELSDRYGRPTAEQAYRSCGRGIDLVHAATRAVGGRCGFRRSPSIYLAPRPSDTAMLIAECEARQRAGFDLRWLDAEQMQQTWGFESSGGMVSSLAGSVDPFRLTHRALSYVRARSGRVYDRTTVVSYDATAKGVCVRTDRGFAVRAKWIVFATGYETSEFVPDHVVTLKSSYAFVSEPVTLDRWRRGFLVWEHADPYLYARTTDDGRVLVGGEDDGFRDPKRRDAALHRKAGVLRRKFGKLCPELALEPAFEWSGTFGETEDGLAYLGAHADYPRAQFALGFGGNGITYSAIAAEIITAALTGRRHPDARLFAFDRTPAPTRPLSVEKEKNVVG